MISAPLANSKEGQEANVRCSREVVARMPPNDRRHQHSLILMLQSFVECWRTSYDGSVVKVITFDKHSLFSEVRPSRQTANAPSVILHEERQSSQSPDGATSGSPALPPYISLILCSWQHTHALMISSFILNISPGHVPRALPMV